MQKREKKSEEMICRTNETFEREGEFWKCKTTRRTNHSCCDLRHCDVQLHFLEGARQTMALGSQQYRSFVVGAK